MTKTFETCSTSQVVPQPPPAATAVVVPSTSSSSNSSGGGDDLEEDGSSKPPEKMRATASHHAKLVAAAAAAAAASAAAPPPPAVAAASSSVVVEEKSVTNLDDEALKALLDEAIAYKTPKDREGKSKLFNTLLTDAEDEIRKDHAYNASGPARHYSTTAKRRHRQRRQPSSISENLTHGGSLNDLAKQELYESAKMQRPTMAGGAKTVSARQREGGSLPCNVNAGAYDKQYFMAATKQQQEERRAAATIATTEVEQTVVVEMPADLDDDMDLVGGEPSPHSEGDGAHGPTEEAAISCDGERAGVGEGDADSFAMSLLPRVPSLYTSKAQLVINKVDDAVSFAQMQSAGDMDELQKVGAQMRDMSVGKMPTSAQQYGLVSRESGGRSEKKLDENGNALAMFAGLGAGATAIAPPPANSSSALMVAKHKKKKKEEKKKAAERVFNANDIVGHRSDIIDNIDMLLSYIDGTDNKPTSSTSSSTAGGRKQLHKQNTLNSSAEQEKSKKRTRKKSTTLLQKSTSMEEISTTKLEDFEVDAAVKDKAPLRPTKSNVERASRHASKPWVVSSEQLASTSSAQTPADSQEIADFIRVTNKKKSKKRRNSLGSRGNRAPSSGDVRPAEFHSLRGAASAARRKSASSAPHSDKSGDSSDNESVHSLPDNRGQPASISYADIAKSSERPKQWNHNKPPPPPPERRRMEKPVVVAVPTPVPPPVAPVVVAPVVVVEEKPILVSVSTQVEAPEQLEKEADLASMQNWPEIRTNKTTSANKMDAAVEWPSIVSNGPPKASPPVKQQAPKCSKPPNNGLKKPVEAQAHDNDDSVQQVIQQVSEQPQFLYPYKMPPNIRDVQSIEMQMQMQMQEQEQQQQQQQPRSSCTSVEVVSTEKPAAEKQLHRPAVVILSSGGADRPVTTDITFGFGINEELLSDDVCADFIGRFFYEPEMSGQLSMQIDTLVNYIGNEWQDVLMQTHTGKVKYYTDDLS